MRECLRCNTTMIEGLQIGSNGTRIVKDNILKNSTAEIKCAVCPELDLCQVFRHDFLSKPIVFKFIPIPLLVMGPQSSFIT